MLARIMFLARGILARMVAWAIVSEPPLPAVGELVRYTNDQRMVRPPECCPVGHRILPGRTIVGTIPCSCGRHLTWRCECGAVTYGPALSESCSLLDGPARVRGSLASRSAKFATKMIWIRTTPLRIR